MRGEWTQTDFPFAARPLYGAAAAFRAQRRKLTVSRVIYHVEEHARLRRGSCVWCLARTHTAQWCGVRNPKTARVTAREACVIVCVLHIYIASLF